MKSNWILLSLFLLVTAAGCRQGETAETDPARQAKPGEMAAAAATTAESSPQVPQTEEPAAWVPIQPKLAYNRRQGRGLFRHYCLPCHGEQGQGDGFNAYNLDPKPRDFSDSNFQKERTDEDLIAVIQGGGGAAGLSTGMPPWGRTLNQRQIANLAIYLRTLNQKPEERTTGN